MMPPESPATDAVQAPPRRAAPPARRPRTFLRDPAMMLWALHIVLYPLYVFPSGLPQPADFPLLLLVPMLFREWDKRLPVPARRALLGLLVFTSYVIVSNLLWSAWMGTIQINLRYGFLLSPTFYIHNALVFLIALVFYKQRGQAFVAVTARAVLIAVVAQIPLSFLIGHASALRSSGTFNNPNQLGYFAVLSASLIMLAQKRANLSTITATVGLIASTYLAVVSASKAALVCTALIIIISTINRLRTVILASIVAGVMLVAFDPIGDAVDRSMQRIQTDESHGFVEERGYDRLLQHPEYWLFGSGEGGYIRFAETTVIGSHELHSSGGTLFFCYGIVGSLLFLAFLFQVLRVAGFRQILIVIPAAAYGLSHQGLRVTPFWIFLALFVIMGAEEAKARARERQRAKPSPPRINAVRAVGV